jgi:probable rRNA maturation factor
VVNAIHAPVSVAFVRGVLHRAASIPEVAARLPEGDASVAVRITDDSELRRLNRDFAGHDYVTDILSFTGSGEHLGDIAVAWPMTLRNSTAYRQPAETELALLFVHGLLHLLGWDHEKAGGRKEMDRITRAALKASGLAPARGRL